MGYGRRDGTFPFKTSASSVFSVAMTTHRYEVRLPLLRLNVQSIHHFLLMPDTQRMLQKYPANLPTYPDSFSRPQRLH
jgi:hypothetical protein